MRIGIGCDTHLLKRGLPLMLGGLKIPYGHGLKGHSDGDIVLHALMDAILGALGEGDIGERFPDRDSRWRGVSSEKLLRHVLRRLRSRRMSIVNIDAVIHAEAPKLGVWKERIRRSMAGLTGLSAARVNIKAKTAEGLGPVGRGRAMSADCAVLLRANRK